MDRHWPQLSRANHQKNTAKGSDSCPTGTESGRCVNIVHKCECLSFWTRQFAYMALDTKLCLQSSCLCHPCSSRYMKGQLGSRWGYSESKVVEQEAPGTVLEGRVALQKKSEIILVFTAFDMPVFSSALTFIRSSYLQGGFRNSSAHRCPH